jgi:hypothetical protein
MCSASSTNGRCTGGLDRIGGNGNKWIDKWLLIGKRLLVSMCLVHRKSRDMRPLHGLRYDHSWRNGRLQQIRRGRRNWVGPSNGRTCHWPASPLGRPMYNRWVRCYYRHVYLRRLGRWWRWRWQIDVNVLIVYIRVLLLVVVDGFLRSSSHLEWCQLRMAMLTKCAYLVGVPFLNNWIPQDAFTAGIGWCVRLPIDKMFIAIDNLSTDVTRRGTAVRAGHPVAL